MSDVGEAEALGTRHWALGGEEDAAVAPGDEEEDPSPVGAEPLTSSPRETRGEGALADAPLKLTIAPTPGQAAGEGRGDGERIAWGLGNARVSIGFCQYRHNILETQCLGAITVRLCPYGGADGHRESAQCTVQHDTLNYFRVC